jgi:hypothetical protein
MVDNTDPSRAAIHLEMMTRDGMTVALRNGVKALTLECTASYNISSKRYNIWNLLRKNIDPPIADALQNFGVQHMFNPGFSGWLRLQTMSKMSVFLKSKIHLYNYSPELIANLESIIEISYFTLAKQPAKKIENHRLRGSNQINHRKKVDYRHYPYCELCWRLCQAAERNLENPERAHATLRFSSEHNPSVQTSMYRQDHRFRVRFHEELLKLKKTQNIEFLSEAKMRAQAYKSSHIRKSSNTVRIAELCTKGLKQSEIAKKLGISRQAVSKSLKASQKI